MMHEFQLKYWHMPQRMRLAGIFVPLSLGVSIVGVESCLLVTKHVVSMINNTTAAWRNGIASDYESGDCRFDPCGGHSIFAVDLIHVQHDKV